MRHWLSWRGSLALGATLLWGCTEDVTQTDTSDGSTSVAPGTSTGQTSDPTTEGPGQTSAPATDSGSGPATSTGTATVGSSGTGPSDSSGGPPATCGNNVIEGDEVCDLAQLNGETCESLGFQGGTLGCLLNCTDYNLLGCFICGNDVVDMAEDCEPNLGVPDGVTCTGMGFEGGDITCGADCLYDLSECSICGDGIQQGPEDCDGLDFGGETCASLGFTSGNLACNIAECAFSYAGCSGGMYIQNFEGGVLPAEFSVDVGSPWDVDNTMPINGTWSARSGMFPPGVGGITNLTLVAGFPAAGDISFMHKESTSAGVDFLEFYVDGIQQMSWSGINAAAMFSTPIAAGMHTFQWRFNRAGFIDAGVNAVFVDDITLSGGVPM